jgi:hypothetical protein
VPVIFSRNIFWQPAALSRAVAPNNERQKSRLAAVVGGLVLGPIAQGLAHPLGMALGSEPTVIPIQGPPGPPGPPGMPPPGGPGPMPGAPGLPGGNPAQAHAQHCAGLQQQAAAIQGQMANTPPSQRKVMRGQLRQFGTSSNTTAADNALSL